ncbi:MAG: DNA internalization-related competence protein ComEC/Rec2 [Lentisphaerae bacterium]|nr:DNA internalization-related competence protein ComEC/Rec2 [Lentisphaerota bacterium]
MEYWLAEAPHWGGGRVRPPRRRAMVGTAMVLIAGTVVGISVPFSMLWFWVPGALLLLPLFVWVRRGSSTAGLMAALFLLVAAHAAQSVALKPGMSLWAIMPRPVEYIRFVALITDDAVPRPGRPGQAAGAVVHARVEGINREGHWQRVDDKIRVVLRGEPEGRRLPRYGERWHMHGVVRPAVPRRSGLFTLPENQAVVDPDRFYLLDTGRGNPVKAACLAFRRKARDILARGLDDYPEERGLLQALLLGYREDLPTLLRRDFAATGTVHIFAISGAHVGMVTMLVMLVLRSLRVPRTRWFWLATPLLVGYTIATGAATSAIRACVMASLVQAAPMLRRKPDAVSILAVAASVILVVSPAQMGDLGFLLSFTAVAGLLAIQPIFDAWAVRTFRRDDWQLAHEELPEGRRFREACLGLTRYSTVTVSAWIGTAPLTAFFFNMVSPVALGMNLVVIPSAFAILLAGVMSLLTAPFGGVVSEIFNHSARAWAQALAALISWAARVPGGHWFVRTPPAAGIVAWYLVLAAAAIIARRIKGALPAGLLVLALLAGGWALHDAQRCRVSVLDVGEGNAVLVQARTRRILIDAGPIFYDYQTVRQLRREGVNRLDALVLTHADAAHIGATKAVMEEIPVRELWVPAEVWPSPLMRAIVAEAEERAIPVRRVRRGDSGHWPGAMYWEVLWPPAGVAMKRADDASLVMRVARFGSSILLTADAGEEVERELIASGAELAAPVLLVARHGDESATSELWLDAVRPREAVISSGQHRESRHPDEALLERLFARDVRVWRTDRQGMICVDMAGAPARYPAPGYRVHAERRRPE